MDYRITKEILKKIYMKNRVTLEVLIWIVILAPFIYVISFWNEIPLEVAIHFDISGQPNGYANKKQALLIFIILNLVVHITMLSTQSLSSKKLLINNFNFNKLRLLVSIFLSFVTAIIFISAVNKNFNGLIISSIAIGICLLISGLGNYMYSIKPNYYFGIRTPWTLNNETVWRKTHQWASKVSFWSGLFCAVLILFTPEKYKFLVITTFSIILSIVSYVYSYIIFKKEKHTSNLS